MLCGFAVWSLGPWVVEGARNRCLQLLGCRDNMRVISVLSWDTVMENNMETAI